MRQQYRYLAVLEGPDPESAAPLFHTEDRDFIALVLRLAGRHLHRAAASRGSRPPVRIVPDEPPEATP